MVFSVKYCDSKGGAHQKTVKAANRVDCIAKCRAQEIVPIEVERMSGSVNNCRDYISKADSGVKPQSAKMLLSIGALVLLGGVAWFWVSGKAVAERGKISNNGDTERGKNTKKMASSSEVMPNWNRCAEAKKIIGSERSLSATKNDFVKPEFPVVGSATNTPLVPTLPPSPFNNASDQVLAMIAQDCTVGSLPPLPISHNIESEFRKSLKQDIMILESDDDKTRELKEAVIAARAEMKKMIDSGMTVSQVLAEYQKLANENAEVRNMAMLELKAILDSGDIDGAVEYKRKINIALQQMGISALSIPVTEEEKAERAIARRERMLKKRERQASAQSDGDCASERFK